VCSGSRRLRYFGWGGGDLDCGSSASPSLGQRGDSSSPAPAGSRQARASPTLFRPVRSEGRGSLEWRSVAAQELARVGMRFDEGTGATSNTPPRLNPMSDLLNPVPVNESTKSHLFFLTQEDISCNFAWGTSAGQAGRVFVWARDCPGRHTAGSNVVRYPLSSHNGNTPLHLTPLHSTPLCVTCQIPSIYLLGNMEFLRRYITSTHFLAHISQ
jgi:hypothetical protein